MKRNLQWPALALLLGAAACSGNNDKADTRPLPLIDIKVPAGGYSVHTAQWVRISPEVKNAEGASYVWTLDKDTVSRERELVHVFAAAGESTFKLNVKTAAGEANQHVSVRVNAQVYTNGVSKVFDFQPAPAQFTNKLPLWEAGDTEAQMTAKAETALKSNGLVCLGGFGGYIVMGFDHTIVNVPGEYNFQVLGNAFNNWAEPGIIQVAADANGNGLPDDAWYEIAGSEYNSPKTVHKYEITYHRPAADHVATPDPQYSYITDMNYIKWTDNKGGSGYMEKNSFHSQNYYPNWKGDKITFSGTMLDPDRIKDQSGAGSFFICPAYEFGYADNWANMEAKSGIKLDWAVDANGKPAKLKGIDFIRVHTGMRAQGGWLGEVSTEVSGVKDLNLK
ncbi:PKD-like domain-containing protein [Chitinophaga sp. NPDC101104]|uniref:PKD-like domain-containing protein n=1 Tax=Chitinophaga sp. NPDC101104 TaxID=3390561 RepID=UPI003D01D74E